ncbi:hypothetical protein MK489_10305, partial [Myxococcota bacterium]|nr:hypothetical protein [Myxococcota bacterium]
MSVPWRWLEHGDGAGPWNMGVDEALLESAISRGEPTLRFYGWQGAWLSLGYGQGDMRPGRRQEFRQAGVGCVWRVTGGRAVLHGGDLTYAVAAPAHRLPEGLQPTYALIADALVEALAELG